MLAYLSSVLAYLSSVLALAFNDANFGAGLK